MPTSLRPARPADIDALVEIEEAAFGHDRISRRSFKRLLERRSALTLVAERDGGIAGYVMVLTRRGVTAARLYSLAVASAFLGKGVGASLLDAAEEEMLAEGRLVMRLEVRPDNDGALALYRRAGYRETGRADGFYEDGSPALKMEKLLAGAGGRRATA